MVLYEIHTVVGREYSSFRESFWIDLSGLVGRIVDWALSQGMSADGNWTDVEDGLFQRTWGIVGVVYWRGAQLQLYEQLVGQLVAKGWTVVRAEVMAANVVTQTEVVTALAEASADAAAVGEMASGIVTLIGHGLYLLAVLALLLIVNPKSDRGFYLDYPVGRYAMRYQEFWWWGDFVAQSLDGRGLYLRCGDVPGVAVSHVRGRRAEGPYGGDVVELSGEWYEKGGSTGAWWTRVYKRLRASHVGLLKRVGSGFYRLADGYSDWTLEGSMNGWVKDSGLWCEVPSSRITYL